MADELDQRAAWIRESFGRQGFMHTLGADLTAVTTGEVRIETDSREELTQQHGFLHAGVVISLIDSACGYAALSQAEPGMEVLTVELKVNLLAPADGDRLRAIGRVLRAGRTLTVCQGDAFMVNGDKDKHVASVLTTMMTAAART